MSPSVGLAVLVLSVVVTCSCETFYIVPDDSTESCETRPCLTLDQVISEIQNQDLLNLTLHFLPGQHFLKGAFHIHNTTNVQLIGSLSESKIWLQDNIIVITEVQNLVLNRLILDSTCNCTYSEICNCWQSETKKGVDVNISTINHLSLKGCTFKATSLKISITKNVTIAKCTFVNTTSHLRLVVTMIYTCRYLYISDSVFANNTAKHSLIAGCNDMYMINCTFEDNNINETVQASQAVTIAATSNVYITSCNFSNTNSQRNGVLIKTNINTTRVQIDNSIFINNSISIVTKDYCGAKIEIVSCKFMTYNRYMYTTLAIYNVNELYINNSTFTNNIGSIIRIKNIRNTKIDNCGFIHNSGWIIKNNDGNLKTIRYFLMANLTLGYGGVFIVNSEHTRIMNCTFSNNHFPHSMIATRSTNTTINDIYFINCTFRNNYSTAGPSWVVDLVAMNNVYISSCKFLNTHPQINGILLTTNTSHVQINNSIFINNTISIKAENCCGAKIEIVSCKFMTYNRYTYETLTIYNVNELYIYSSNFTNNIGGIIGIENVRNAKIDNCDFIHNSIKSNDEILEMASYINVMANLTLGYEGVFIVNSEHTRIMNCTFSNNHFPHSMIATRSTNTTINDIYFINCTFRNNYITAGPSWVVDLVATNCVYISSCNFLNTYPQINSILLATNTSHVQINNSIFINNAISVDTKNCCGAEIEIISCKFMIYDRFIALDIYNVSKLYIYYSTFTNNTFGTILTKNVQNTKMDNCSFINNSDWLIQNSGGNFEMVGCVVSENLALALGGVLIENSKHARITNCTFSNNHFPNYIIIIRYTKTAILEESIFTKNTVTLTPVAPVIDIAMTGLTLIQVDFKQNNGSVRLTYSEIYIKESVTFNNNIGGAITAIQSKVYVDSKEDNTVYATRKIIPKGIFISNNTGWFGGGITLRESEMFIKSSVTILLNKAHYGGGIYAQNSIIEVEKSHYFKIMNNQAKDLGGGIYATASTIKIIANNCLEVEHNAAKYGGGLYLERNSKIFLYQYIPENVVFNVKNIEFYAMNISKNSANYAGGGIYVADNTTAGFAQCIEGGTTCFVQINSAFVINRNDSTADELKILLTKNTANKGSAIYGGLLDRCIFSKYDDGQQLRHTIYIAEATNEQNDSQLNKTQSDVWSRTITSEPLQLQFCEDKINPNITIKKGESFKISVRAIDQVGNPLNTTIYSFVHTESGVGHLNKGQVRQKVGDWCTELEYNVFSQDNFAQIELFAEGPCINLGISKKIISITFLPCICPLGLQPSQSPTECVCECDQKLRKHNCKIVNCSQKNGTIQLETNTWIGAAKYMDGVGYIIHDCPFDYCVEKPVNISLNSSQERDKQCAFNRSGFLCGECQQGLSLVLATSRCKQCSNNHIFLLIPFALAGIALVGFILFFNLSMATGTVHGLIFYSNLLTVNYFKQPSVLTVFTSWVNLDLGIETCFYDGMTSQAKVLLQLVFPTYLLLLIFIIIILCRYFNFFAKLLSKRNPVAALCTLIFMTYSKLIQFIIAALQSTILEFPDGSTQRVWMYDGNIHYLSPSQAPQFVAGVLIIFLSGLFTLQLFFSQWFPRCSEWKIMKWTKITKYTAFTDAYHAPFTDMHRYWMGLLLFALIIHNTVAAMASDDSLPVLSMGCVAIGLLVVKLVSKRIHNSSVNNLLETVFLLNLVFLAYGTIYLQNCGKKYTALADVSMGLSAILFLMIVCYHSYEYIYLQSKFYKRHKTNINKFTYIIKVNFKRDPNGQEMKELVSNQEGSLETSYTAVGSDYRRELDLNVLVPITANDYIPAPATSNLSKPCSKVTQTVVHIKPDAHIKYTPQ